MSWEDYNGAVLSPYEGRLGLAGDALKAHLVQYIRDNLSTILVTSGSTPAEIKCWGDYQKAENMHLPSIIVTIQKEVERNRYIGNFLFDYTDTASGIAASGSYDAVYGGEYEFLVRFDIWTSNTMIRDMIDWELQNLLRYASSPYVNDMYDKGIRNIRVIGSELIGYDQTDRYIKDVSYHVGVDTIYRREVLALINADVRIVPKVEPNIYLIGEIVYEVYSSASGTTYDNLVASGTVSGSG